MLRINLLPEHFAQARRARRLIGVFGVLIALTILFWLLVPGVGWIPLGRQIAHTQHLYNGPKETGDPEEMPDKGYHEEAEEVRAIEQKTTDLETQRQPYGERVDVCRDIEAVPAALVAAMTGIEQHIFAGARVTSLSVVAPGQLSLTAETDSIESAGRFYLNILRCEALSNIAINVGQGAPTGGGAQRVSGGSYDSEGPGPGGGGAAAPTGGVGLIPISLSASLTKPVPLPTLGAAAAAGPAPGYGAPPAMGAPSGAAGTSEDFGSDVEVDTVDEEE